MSNLVVIFVTTIFDIIGLDPCQENKIHKTSRGTATGKLLEASTEGCCLVLLPTPTATAQPLRDTLFGI